MAGKPSPLKVGEHVYTIWQEMLVGRCQTIRIEFGAGNPQSGKPRSPIYEKRLGISSKSFILERAIAAPVIMRQKVGAANNPG